MDRQALMDILPHRDGMLLVDSAEVVDGEAIGKKTVRPDEWFLQGHFPGDPVVPGVLLCEIMAQSTCVLLAGQAGPGCSTLLTGIESARFKAPVRPGDVIETRCKILKSRPPFYWAEGTASVDGRLCAAAKYSFAVSGGD